MSAGTKAKEAAKSGIRTLVPLSVRKRLAVWLQHRSGLSATQRGWWSQELVRDLAEKDFILAKLEENNWNISQTAREIDTPRSNLYKKLEQYGIKITAGVGEAVAPDPDEG